MTGKSGAIDAPISEAAKAKARELLGVDALTGSETEVATFIQEVSDAATPLHEALAQSQDGNVNWRRVALAPFILPEPVDPLGEVLRSTGWAKPGFEARVAENFRNTLAKRGLKIVEEET